MSNEINCFERLEYKVDKSITAVRFINPDGVIDKAEPFCYQPIDISYNDEGIETIRENGECYFCVRYTPRVTGVLTVEYIENENVIKTDTITVLPSDNHGYVTISKRDKRYFEYSDGTFFPQIGVNMAFPNTCRKSDGTEFGLADTFMYMGLRQYERWIKKAAANGVNVVRLWLGHDYFSPDTEDAYEFDMVQFSKIDEIVKIAKKYNVMLKITIEHFRAFDYEYSPSGGGYADLIWRLFNRQLYIDGTACRDSKQWLKDSKWGDAWINKVAELSKRYAGDTTIFTVELWNEMNCVGEEPYDVIEWNKKYLPMVKKLFPHNMVTNSLGSLDNDYWQKYYKDFCWDECDFIQMHKYLDQGAANERNRMNPIEVVCEGFEILKPDHMPVLLAEVGAVNNCHSGPFKYYACDDDGLIFADSVYTPLFCNSCGVGNLWHWDERYLESKNLYHMYKPIAKLLEGVDMADEHFEAFDMSNDDAYVLLLKGKTTTLGYIRNKDASWQNILRDMKEVKIVDKLVVDINNAGNVELVPIWDDNTMVTANADNVVFENIKYGIMFKVKI